jgi:hypothetical protein
MHILDADCVRTLHVIISGYVLQHFCGIIHIVNGSIRCIPDLIEPGLLQLEQYIPKSKVNGTNEQNDYELHIN